MQLRAVLKEAGLRELEREATYAIEYGKAKYARAACKTADSLEPNVCLEETHLLVRVGGWLQLVLFEWTTGWGLYPGRALLILPGVMVVLSVAYTYPIAASPEHASPEHGIVKVWPADLIKTKSKTIALATAGKVERLSADVPATFA